jgi:hypothetical protein
MTKNFDSICNKILGETILSVTPSPNQQKPSQPTTPQPGQPNQPAQPNASTPQLDPELAKAFETLTKHAGNNQDHAKAVTALQQLMAAQQQNAANQKPA